MKTKNNVWKIHFFCSTGAFHWNGIARKRGAKPSDAEAALIAREKAMAFAAEKGQPLSDFSVRLIGK